MTKNLLKFSCVRLSNLMEIVAGTALVSVMLLSGWDIVGRAFGHPIPGAYEIVSFAGGLIIGLAVPITSIVKGHVCVDLLLEKLPGRIQSFLFVVTRLMGAATFLFAGYGMFRMGMRLKASGEVTAALSIPFYPVAYAVGAAFFVQVLILLSQIAEKEPAAEKPALRNVRYE